MSNCSRFPFSKRGLCCHVLEDLSLQIDLNIINSLNLLLLLRLFLLISSRFLSRQALSQMLGSCIVQQSFLAWKDVNISISSNAIPSARAFETVPLYHSVYFLFKKAFAAPLTVKSNGWNKLVIFGSTRTKNILFSRSFNRTGSVICPLKTCINKKAGWLMTSSFRLRSERTYGMIILSRSLRDSVVLLKCFSFALKENALGNSNLGKVWRVFPTWIN